MEPDQLPSEPTTTEDNILSEVFGEDTRQSAEPETTPTETAQPEAQPQQPQQPQFVSGVKPDANGNLVDQSGQVVAQSGRERRMYAQVVNENEQLRSEVERFRTEKEALDNHYKQLGATPQDMQIGVNFAVEWKRDPIGAIRSLLTRAQQSGMDLSSLNVAPQVDQQSLLDGFRELMNPVLSHYQQQERETEATRQATEQWNGLVAETNGNASIHGDDIGALMNADPTLSMREAYLKLALFAQTNGLDMSQPLNPQYEARMQQQAQPQAAAPSVPRNVRAGGSSAPATTVVAGNQSMQDIINAAMAEAQAAHGFSDYENLS